MKISALANKKQKALRNMSESEKSVDFINLELFSYQIFIDDYLLLWPYN